MQRRIGLLQCHAAGLLILLATAGDLRSQSATYSGLVNGLGTAMCSDGSTQEWSAQGTVTVTVSPAPPQFTAGQGGSFSGTWSVEGNGNGCGQTFPVSSNGSVTGSLSPNNVLRVQFSVGQCSLTALGTSPYAAEGGVPASCVDPSLSGNLGYTFSTGSAAPPTTLGNSGTTTNPTGSFAEPVNTATGNYYLTVTDLSVHGRGLNFVWDRYYNSRDGSNGPLGMQWNHSYNTSLVSDTASGTVNVKDASGGLLNFTLSGSAYTCLTPGCLDVLEKNVSGNFVLMRKNKTRLTFSAAGALQSVADRNGNTQNLTYSAAGDLTSITDTVGRIYTLAYDSSHRIISLTDPGGRVVRYAYDSNGSLISFTDANGGITQYAYDANHEMLTTTDPRGVVTVQNTFDSTGRVTAQKNAVGDTTQFAYSSGTTRVIDANGNTIQHIYDPGLRLIQTIDGTGSTLAYAYDPNNQTIAITNPNHKITKFIYDTLGNTTSTTDAAGNNVIYVYGASDNLLSVTDAAGHTTTRTYDSQGNLLTAKDALAGLTQNTYDSQGELLSTVDPAGNRTEFQDDSEGNLTQVTDGAGRVRKMGYDSLGRLLSTTDGLGQTSRIQYDALDHVTSRTY
jgi:YD repeat-containing protein